MPQIEGLFEHCDDFIIFMLQKQQQLTKAQAQITQFEEQTKKTQVQITQYEDQIKKNQAQREDIIAKVWCTDDCIVSST